jgi:hypothetical protein
LPEVRVPARAFDPAAHHVVAARHQVRIKHRLSGQDRQDLVADFRSAALVRVQAEDPIEAAFLNRLVAQVAKSAELDLHDPRAEFLGNLNGPIGAAGVCNHDLVRPQNA